METEEKKYPEVLQRETSRRGFLKGAAVAAGGAVALATIGVIKPAAVKAANPAPPPKMIKHLFVERQNCTGCRGCEFACSLFHEGVVRPEAARVHVNKYKGIIDIPVICWHCEDAPCIAACPVEPTAIYKDEKTNGILLNKDTCLGAKCSKCVEACPAQFLRLHPDTGHPLTCDLCGGDPECVKACLAQSGNPQGPCIMGDKLGFGVNLAYRDVTPVEAAKDMTVNFFYPNETGERRAI